ncbi:non-heme iron oxygenase ferredoxin subunit [Nocardia miyunensis]|uniref:non-heme iron oxygenase ferredoxin subunit n=1 Tax=Nocardia miyunensis TaxID=282684 RepID=UPI000829CD9C|nr:non-heme iron oxygenase ferredoxin subunit [Nocardia miyunensis]
MTEGIKVAKNSDIPEGEGLAIPRSITGTDDDIAILHDTDGTFWALNDTCTHQVASLAEGWVEDGTVECPIHASRFCLKSGRVSGLPATRGAVCHRVEVRGEDIWLFPGESPAV